MATQTIIFTGPTGRTLTAKLFPHGSDTIQESVSATEATNRKGYYSAAFTDAPAGDYSLHVFEGSNLIGVGIVNNLTLSTSTFYESELVERPTAADVATILTRIPSTLFAGITSLANWLGALAGKTADTSTRAEINATTAGATYNETTDSQEAIRDRGDAAWTTGAGGGGGGSTVESFSAGALQQLAGLKVTLKSPTLRGAVFDPPLIRGRDYSASDSNSLDVNVSGWTDFTGATVALVGTLRDEDGVVRESISWTGSVVNAGAATQTLRFQPTASQTTIARGNYECETVVTLGSGRVVSPAGVFVLPVIGA